MVNIPLRGPTAGRRKSAALGTWPAKLSGTLYRGSAMPNARKARALPKIPRHLAPLRTVRLRAHDWRRLIVFLLRRLYRSEPKIAKQFAHDVYFFAEVRRTIQKTPRRAEE
jgi:hypothetical protein